MIQDYARWREDPEGWARRLGISREAIDLYAACDSIDLHVESFLWTRLTGYRLDRRHDEGLFNARFYSHVDLPRLLESGMTGAVFSIATNPFRRQARRTPMALANLARLKAELEAHPEQLAVVKDHAGYVAARRAGKVACWLAIQGGNAFDSGPDDLARIPDDCVSRITVVHLSNSTLGATSAPSGAKRDGLTPLGADYIRQMNARHILVDLAHISADGFWAALAVHDRSQPAIVSHTGVRAVHDMWRNLDDAQVRAVAELGGLVGIIFHTMFLGREWWNGRSELILDHMEHVIRVAGDEVVALGSDWDGLIVTPRDMKTVLELPVLVQGMLERGWSPDRVGRILGGNYLRVLRAVRPGV